MAPTFPTEPTEVTLADGVTRHLRYSLAATKRIKEKFGADPMDILKTPAEELLPRVLMEGIVEKEGLTEARIMDDLVTGPMVDYVTFQFIAAFFGQRAKSAFELIYQNQEAILAKLATPAPQTQTVQ